MIIPAPPFFFLFTLFFFPPFPPLSLLPPPSKGGGGGGEGVGKGNFQKGEEKGGHLLVIDLQTCQHQSCPLWEKAKREVTQIPSPPPPLSFFLLLFFPARVRKKEGKKRGVGGGE